MKSASTGSARDSESMSSENCMEFDGQSNWQVPGSPAFVAASDRAAESLQIVHRHSMESAMKLMLTVTKVRTNTPFNM